TLTRAAPGAGHVSVEEVVVGAIGRQRPDRGCVPRATDLDHGEPGAAPDLVAVRGPFVAVELDHRERDVLDRLEHFRDGRVDEYARHLDPSPNRRRDLGSRLDVTTAGALRIEVRADRPRAELARRARVAAVRDAADLHVDHGRPIVDPLAE